MPIAATLTYGATLAPMDHHGLLQRTANKLTLTPSVSLPANTRLVQTSATGSVDILKILTAFAHGADGVMVAWIGRATETQRRRVIVLRELLHFIGCHRDRLMLLDGAPDEASEAAFKERVRELGAWVFDGSADLRAEIAALPLHNVAAHAPVATSQALRKAAAELLRSGKVEGVLAWGQGTDEIRPTLARTPEQAGRLFAGGRGYPNLATMLEMVAEQNVAVVVRPAELACIQALREDGIHVPEALFLIGQGVAPGECDLLLPGSSDVAGLPVGDELAALESWALSDRASFWAAQFSNCVHCDGCRSACPFQCYTNCLGDALAPHNGHAPGAAQTACAHLACAARLAGHCVGCESCSAACPQSVPLYLLHQKASQVLATLA
jgi:coenzyme F420-reducing hydrogenase delta subunit/ferredoxin